MQTQYIIVFLIAGQEFCNKGDNPVINLRFRDHGKKEWISVEGHDEYVITW